MPKAGVVYLKVVDPPSNAPYDAGSHEGDNEGPVAEFAGGQGGTVSAQANSDGNFEATLVINSKVVGDNWQVIGAADENLTCGSTSCPRSAVFTLWKRIYVEQESMFKNGSFLTDAAAAGTNSFDIDDPAPFSNLALDTPLKLIHANTATEGFYADTVLFKALQQDATGQWMVVIDDDLAHGGTKIPRNYGTAVAATPNLAWKAVVRDAVGIPSAGTYDADSSIAVPLLASAFVDVKSLPASVPGTPFVRSLTELTSTYYPGRWFQNTQGAAIFPHAQPNVLHRIAVRQADPLAVTNSAGALLGYGVELGRTAVLDGGNYSLIFDQRIRDLSTGPAIGPNGVLIGAEYTGTNATVVNRRTTAHETIHFFVHDGGTDQQGHCDRQQYDNPNLTCLLHQPGGATGLDNPNVHLHYVITNNTVDSEYLVIRRAADPVPQN